MGHVLTETELTAKVANLPGWQVEGTNGDRVLSRTFVFKDFAEALQFVNRVAEAAEQAGHHPDINIRYNRVCLELVSHDEGGITLADINLAQTIGNLG